MLEGSARKIQIRNSHWQCRPPEKISIFLINFRRALSPASRVCTHPMPQVYWRLLQVCLCGPQSIIFVPLDESCEICHIKPCHKVVHLLPRWQCRGSPGTALCKISWKGGIREKSRSLALDCGVCVAGNAVSGCTDAGNGQKDPDSGDATVPREIRSDMAAPSGSASHSVADRVYRPGKAQRTRCKKARLVGQGHWHEDAG